MQFNVTSGVFLSEQSTSEMDGFAY